MAIAKDQTDAETGLGRLKAHALHVLHRPLPLPPGNDIMRDECVDDCFATPSTSLEEPSYLTLSLTRVLTGSLFEHGMS